MGKTYERDADGNVLNPPILQEYEQRLAAAHLAADQDRINEVQAEYNEAREARVAKDEGQAQETATDEGDQDQAPEGQGVTPNQEGQA